MLKSYRTVSGETENTEIIEKSRFITYIKNVENEEQAKEFVAKIKKQHSLATHNCYAYIADKEGNVQKFSDDKEPQGTAGMPMLETLKSLGLTEVCAVVTRYFGGIKLGTGGLARAYSGGVKNCADKCKIKDLYLSYVNRMEMDFTLYGKFVSFNGSLSGFKVIATDFGENVKVTFAVKEDVAEKTESALSAFFAKNIELEKDQIIYTDF